MINKRSGKNVFALIRIVLCIVLCVMFALMSIGSIGKVDLCLYHSMTGRLCPGCGGTRAMISIMHLDFKSAFNYNPVLTLFFFPAFFLLVIDDAACLINRLCRGSEKESFVEYIIYGSFIDKGNEAKTR